MSRLASLCASLGARARRTRYGSDVVLRAPFSSSSSPFRPPPMPLPTAASELSRHHGAAAPALVDSLTGRVTTFSRLEATAEANARELRRALGGLLDDGGGETRDDGVDGNVDPETGARAAGPRVAVLGPPSAEYAAALWGIWSAGACAVPLHHSGVPEASMAASLSDVGAAAVVFSPSSPSSRVASFEERAASLASLAATTADANGKMIPRAPVCLPWSALSGGEEYRGDDCEEGRGGDDEPRGDDVPRGDDGDDGREEGRQGLSPSPPPLPSPRSLSLGALVVFTSGTTGRPKPALHSHLSLSAQAASLRRAWDLRGGTAASRPPRRRRPSHPEDDDGADDGVDDGRGRGDVVYNALPWHHVHGLVNALLAPLAAGCAVEVAPGFSPVATWLSLCRGRGTDDERAPPAASPSPSALPFVPFRRPVTVFMGVPTMYSHLLTSLEGEGGARADYGRATEARAAALPSTSPAARAPGVRQLSPPSREEAAEAAASLRISICGSAACPVPLARAWDELVERGKRKKMSAPAESDGGGRKGAGSPEPSPTPSSSLLERYGMTEAGMILGQGLRGPRVRGVVGRPMPGVEVRLRRMAGADGDDARGQGDGDGDIDSLSRDEGGGAPALPPLPPATGELLVRWPGMFSAYWGRAEATRVAFSPGGWFATGDVAARGRSASGAGVGSSYRLLGRASVDILKVGGEKVSALEVEDALLSNESVAEAAVVALEGGARGDAVGAVLVAKRSSAERTQSSLSAADGGGGASDEGAPRLPPPPLPTLEELRSFVSSLLPRAAVPTSIAWVDSLPRNAMGKVDKRRARELAFPSGAKKSVA